MPAHLRRMTALRAAAALAVGATVFGSAVANAAWTRPTPAASSGGAGTLSTSVSVARTSCSGSNHTLTLTYTVPTGVPSSATLKVYRGTSTGNETLYATTTVGTIHTYADTAADHNSNNFYKVQLTMATNWIGALSTETNTTSC
jgi:hypothetical protein